jgi:hypothetical protein
VISERKGSDKARFSADASRKVFQASVSSPIRRRHPFRPHHVPCTSSLYALGGDPGRIQPCRWPPLLVHSYLRALGASPLKTKRDYLPTHFDHPNSHCEKVTRQDELLRNGVVLAESISVLCVALCVSSHDLDGQRTALWKALLDAGHKRTSR